MGYMKYFFGYELLFMASVPSGRLFLGAIVLEEGDSPKEPDNFLKWYEEGDLKDGKSPHDYTVLKTISQDDVNFSVDTAIACQRLSK